VNRAVATVNGHQTAAVVRAVKDVSVESWLPRNGELHFSQTYRDCRDPVDAARHDRRELEGKGWTAPNGLSP
jgi:hypothetical protein